METIQITRKENYAIVALNRGKVNAIDHGMVKELKAVLKEIAEDDAISGMVMTGKPHFFSAGLDVIELYGYDKAEIASFFEDFASLHLDMVKFEKPFVCAVTGHSPAGGCVLAMTADYRIMAEGGNYSIGLNEVAVNIQISQSLVNGYGFWLGTGRANSYILEGKLLSSQEALDSGLIQEIAPLEEVLPSAEKKLRQYLGTDSSIFRSTKQKLRNSWFEGLSKDPKMDSDEANEMWWRPDIRAKMKGFIESLQKK